MSSNLFKIEIDILKSIIEENDNSYPSLKIQFQHLFVKSRENTGVGFYIHFSMSQNLADENHNDLISSEKSLFMEGLEHEVNYVLAITNGRIDFLEIVSNAYDIFDKNIDEYKFELK